MEPSRASSQTPQNGISEFMWFDQGSMRTTTTGTSSMAKSQINERIMLFIIRTLLGSTRFSSFPAFLPPCDCLPSLLPPLLSNCIPSTWKRNRTNRTLAFKEPTLQGNRRRGRGLWGGGGACGGAGRRAGLGCLGWLQFGSFVSSKNKVSGLYSTSLSISWAYF